MCLGGVEGASRPYYLQNCKKVGQKVGHAARELAILFPVTLCLFSETVVGQMVKTPSPQGECLGASLVFI